MESSPLQLPRYTPFGLVEYLVEKIIGLRSLENHYKFSRMHSSSGKEFLGRLLQSLDIDHQIVNGSISRIPDKGASIIVANHPFGGIDGVALAHFLMQKRDDVKVLTNEFLCRIPELKDIFIGVDLFNFKSKEKNMMAIKEAISWVNNGHQLLIFPSGQVSSYDKKMGTICDPIWKNTASSIALKANAKVTPIFIEGFNSQFFHYLGRIHPRLRTMWLVRELINKEGSILKFRIGKTLESKELSSFSTKQELTKYLRLYTYLLSHQDDPTINDKYKIVGAASESRIEEAIVSETSSYFMRSEVEGLSHNLLLLEKGDISVYCAGSKDIPYILREIGRLREVTFRKVGEGSGMALDLDKYDQYYQHLFLWNKKKSEVVGAYRIGCVDSIIKEHGIHGLYSRSLFHYSNDFIYKLGFCLEMGRSFVRPEYQKSMNALFLLWRGICTYVALNPKYKVLFGPVSISSEYNDISRQLMATYLSVNNSDQALAELVRPTTPLPNTGVFWSENDLKGISNIDKLSSLIQHIEKDNKGVPVLLRQYLKCQGELAAFNVNPDFNNTLAGLIIVDLLKVGKNTLSKYMGKEESNLFIEYHRKTA